MEGLFSQPAKDRLLTKTQSLSDRIIDRFEFAGALGELKVTDTNIDVIGVLNDKDGLLRMIS
jgi:hypothetical protein